MNHKVFVLLSGGIDSSTALAIAAHEFPNDPIETLCFDYGQRHKTEMDSASNVADIYGANLVNINIQGLLSGMLVDKGESNEAIPEKSYADLPEGISPTYVSFRNGTMLALAAARAQAWVMQQEESEEAASPTATIYCGVHADDGVNWAYPDCTPEFIGGMTNAIYIGTYNKVRLRAPLLYMNKAAVVREGLRLEVPYGLTWSCYKGGKIHCGVCPTCRSRREAFAANNVTDPTTYEKDF